MVDAVARNGSFSAAAQELHSCAFSSQLHRSSVRGVAGRTAFCTASP
ncbi:hypothetical protein SEK29439_15698 [Salmonella enterica subsp. enterica serovar Kentucky str. 29439]|nr:hypothetical protein SEK29439_15698 [Salmonella enterica subsp. enterica serovar Kentucky str. 29439]